MRHWSVLMVLSLGVALAFGCFPTEVGSSPEGVARGFVEALARGDDEAALQYIEPDIRDSFGPTVLTTFSGIQASIDQVAVYEDPNGDPRTRVVRVFGDFEGFHYPEYMGNEPSRELRVYLVNSDGRWYVANVTTMALP